MSEPPLLSITAVRENHRDNEKNNEALENVSLDKEIQTGDSTDIVKWVVITIVAMASIFIVIFTRKKESKRMK